MKKSRIDMGNGMDQKTMARMAMLPAGGDLTEIASGLEEYAVQFPESRDEVIGLMEEFSRSKKGSENDFKETAERIAAISMLEILCGK